jgi:membrane protein DedA with SNARE-associated domain
VRWSIILAAIRILSMPLASLSILQILQNALNILGYPAVTLFVMIESSGIPFPGETMLLLASFYSAIDNHLQIPFVIACAALGAIVGDNLGYYIGRTGGKAIIERYGRYVFIKPEHLERGEKFFARYGDKTVFFGRFVAVLRAWAAFLAGVNRMHWRTFFIYNAAGGIVWATIYGLLGYYAGRFFHDNFTEVEHLARTISWTGAGIIAAGVIIAIIVYRVRRRHAPKKQSQKQ